jgi:hypothetical protein
MSPSGSTNENHGEFMVIFGERITRGLAISFLLLMLSLWLARSDI